MNRPRRIRNARRIVVVSRPRRRGTGYLISPSASWDGTLTWSGRTPPVDPTRTTFKPAARFGVVPYQDIAGTSGEFTIPVLAYCRGGIASVQFWCEGNTVTITSKTKITEYNGRPFEAYRCAIDISRFPASINGPIEIFATVTPNDPTAQARVISMTLFRDSGTAPKPVRYVSPTGNDTTGTGTELNPFQTIWAARNSIRTELAGDVGGATIYLEAGSYAYGPASTTGNGTAPFRWLNIMPKPGVARANCIINSVGSPSGLRSAKIHLKDITFSNAGITTAGITGTTSLWMDGTHHTGAGRTVDAQPYASFTEQFATDAYCTDYRDAFPGLLIRNCSVGLISSDAFTGSRCVIQCDVDEIDASGTVFHPDVWQVGAGGVENIVLYGLVNKNTASTQGIFSNGNDAAGVIRDMAVVNSIVQCNGNNQFLDQNIDHYCNYNCNFLTGSYLFRDPDATADNTFQRIDLQQNIFQSLGSEGVTAAAGLSSANIAFNHFSTGSTFGTNATTGTGVVDANDTPTSPLLRPSGTPQLTICDIWGNDRPSTGTAVGPVEAAAP